MIRSNLRDILTERGLKQKYIAEKTGLNRNTISDIVNGKKPEIESALKIAAVLEMHVEEIWSVEEEQG
ncbi:helix-turn-helix transcriptional regulator [Paenibacillus sp. HJGM_3]|uniref:helix-turn-helix transcriptional regulator n=1 Tax=Paenibacillus sp. HJGM_3 TaxID=3379816 RepID=UPI003859B44F